MHSLIGGEIEAVSCLKAASKPVVELGLAPRIPDSQSECFLLQPTDNVHQLGIDPVGTQSGEKIQILRVEKAGHRS